MIPRLFCGNREKKFKKVQSLLEKGRFYMKRQLNDDNPNYIKDSNKAIECFRKVNSLDPENVEAWLSRSKIAVLRYHAEQKDHYKEEALRYIDRVLELSPDDPELWDIKARTCELLYKYELAEEAKQKCKQLRAAQNKAPNQFKSYVTGKDIQTEGGLLVKSRGEQMIARFLDSNRIDYDYNKQIALEGVDEKGYSKAWVRPAFYLNEFHIIIEYWDFESAPGSDIDMDRKKRVYKESRIPFISITSGNLDELDDTLRLKLERLGCRVGDSRSFPGMQSLYGVS